jgi:hypothetical protein
MTDFELQVKFLKEHFDFEELKKIGFYSKDIKKKDYQKQIDRICQYFGFESIFQYNFETTSAHLSYAKVKRPKGEPFVTVIKAWHES